ncbi:lantibiotic dehydratase [Actinomadura chibensis]|uniref:Lantibiotic dehydratase n=1 Tax=Actinomadura chibensis TaxID=392828 RepID=A0A5D0NIQ0_9ACTN|nr:lantibiotic dehydratase [Actinomadura chibensis]
MAEKAREAAAGWELLPTLVVRSAAFPWELAAEISYPKAGELAEEVVGLERAARDLLAAPPADAGRPNRSVLSRLRNLRPLPPEAPVPDDWLAAWNRTTSRLEQARERLAEAIEGEGGLVRDAFERIVADERFLDAVVCSSPGVYRDLRRGRTGARLRRQVASYVQRLCAKCETMSFFGPINYGRVDPAGATGFAWSGHRECVRRAFPAARVIDGLVDRVLDDPALVAGLVPRRKTWTAPVRDAANVVGCCDGARTVADIGGAAEPEAERAAADIVAAVRRGLLTHDLCPPATVPDALGRLRERLRERGDAAAPLSRAADETAALLARYPAAPPDEKLELQARVAEIAGGDAPAGTGERFYNDRVAVHEAAVGTLQVAVGGAVADDLTGLVPRALAHLAAEAERTRRLTGAHLARRLGRGVFGLRDALSAGTGLHVQYSARLTGRIAEVLETLPAGTASVDLARAGLLDEPEPPSKPVLCSVDVMVAAPDLDRYRPGATPLVLGDIHDAALLTPWALQFHPGAQQAIRERDAAIERALTGCTALNVVARRRTGLPPLEFPGPVLELGGTSAQPDRRRIGLERLTVHSDGERVTLRAKGIAGPLLFHNGELESAVHTALALPRVRRPRLPDLPHVPRLTWGNVVLSRRRWRLADAETAPLAKAADADRLIGMARLRADRGLPARFFASSPAERKPVYVDARSPALLDGLVRLARTAERITVSEALPGPRDCWLRDGPHRFAAELRCVYLRGAG